MFLAWNLFCGTFCLFGPKDAVYLKQVLSDTFCPFPQHSNHMLTAAGVLPGC